MEARRRPRGPRERARRQHAPDARNEPGGGDHPRPRRRGEALGGHGGDPSQGEDRRAPPRAGRERDLRRQRPRSHALGRAARVRRRSGTGRLHLRAALRAAPGDQRQRHRAAVVRAVPQRPGAGRREPRHPRGREARGSALGGQHPPGAQEMSRRAWIFASAIAVASQGVQAQEKAASGYAFATRAEGGAILGARDDYVRAMTGFERSVRLRTRDPVDEDRLVEFMRGAALDWAEEEKRVLRPLLAELDRFLAAYKWKRPEKILLVVVNADLEDGFPHTRGRGVMLPRREFSGPWSRLVYVVSHET